MHPVNVKCYFAPISVESRLLEWRKRAAGRAEHTAQDPTEIVYKSLDDDDEEEDGAVQRSRKQEEAEEAKQTDYLLGKRGIDEP